MQAVSNQYLRAIANPVSRVAEVKVTLPGEMTATELDIETDECTVTMSGSDGARYSASLALSPNPDAFALASVPGAEFRIRAGVDYGGGNVEWVDCGVLYAVEGDQGIALGDFPITLQDGSTRLEESRFSVPWAVSSGTERPAAINALVLDASPDVVVRNSATPSLMGSAVYERDRLQAIVEIAQGGSIDAAFNASGEWVTRDTPVLMPAAPSWVLRTGVHGTILENARRKIPLSRLFNRVVVAAPEPFQTWGAIILDIADPTHPRHHSKIGYRPAFVSDPTITSAAQARRVAEATMARLLSVVEEIDIPTLGNAALEYGDTVVALHESTETDPGLAANYLVEGWTFNLGTGAQDIQGRSTDLPEFEESG